MLQINVELFKNVNEMISHKIKRVLSSAKIFLFFLSYLKRTESTSHYVRQFDKKLILFFSHENVIVVDLGRLKILSDLQLTNSNLEDATKLELEEKLYDRFHFTFLDFQILMFVNGKYKNIIVLLSFSMVHSSSCFFFFFL